MKISTRVLAVAVVIACMGLTARAATYTWDIAPGSVGAGNGAIDDGSGNWDTTSGNWTSDGGANNVAWTSNLTDIADFGGFGGGGVTVSESLPAGGLLFSGAGAGNYTFVGAGGPTLTLGTGGITVSTFAGSPTLDSTLALSLDGSQSWINNGVASLLTVNSAVSAATASTLTVDGAGIMALGGILSDGAGALGLTKSGAGTLILSGVNTYSGTTTISAGKLLIVTGASCGNSAVLVSPAGAGALGVSITDNTKQQGCASLTTSGGSPNLDFDFDVLVTPSTSVAPLLVNGNVDFSATPTVSVLGTLNVAPGVSYPLMRWTGTLSGTAPTNVVLSTGIFGNLTVSSSTLWLNITVDPTPIAWAVGNGVWDTNATANWMDSTFVLTKYQDGRAVVFDDTASGTSPITVTLNTIVNPVSVTVNNTNKAYRISGSGSIGGATGVAKSGAGTLTLYGRNTYSGPTTISAGKLAGVTGGSCSNSAVTVADGATNRVQVASAGGTWTCSSLTYAAGTTCAEFDFGANAPSASTAPLRVRSDIAINGTLNVIVRGNVAIPAGTYPLIQYDGTLSGTPPAAPFALPSGMAASLVNNTGNKSIDLSVTAGNEVKWAVGDGNWDIDTTVNWKDTSDVPAKYLDGEAVLFDDTASGTTPITVTLDTIVNPAVVTVNNTNKAYTIAGSGSISGEAGLTKSAEGTLTLSGANDYSGGTILSAGTLNINNGGGATNSAIGAGTFTIAGGSIDNTSAGDVTLASNNPQNWNGSFTYVGSVPRNLNLGTGAVTVNAASQQVTVTAGTLTAGGSVTAPSFTTLTVAGTGNAIIGGVVSDTGRTLDLRKNGTGELTVNGAWSSIPTTSGGYGLTVDGGGTVYIGSGINDFGLKNGGRGGPAVQVGTSSSGNTLRSESGGRLQSHSLVIGAGTSGNNSAILTSPGASGNETVLLGGNGQKIVVGESSSFNSLYVANGAYLLGNGGNGTIRCDVGLNVGADNNSLTVTGTNSSTGGKSTFRSASGSFNVGASGANNALTVRAGGQAILQTLRVSDGGINNTVTVTDIGSFLSAPRCTFVAAVSNGTDNSLIVTNGASIFTSARDATREERSLLLAGGDGANNNRITVTGAGSLLTVGPTPSAENTMSIGLNNTRLGTVSVSATNNSLNVVSEGAVRINNPLLMGGANSAFNLGDGMGISTATMYGVSLLVEDARLKFNSGMLQGGASGALVSGPGIVTNVGPAYVSTAFENSIDSVIAGSGSLTKLDTGTLTLTATNTFSGATIVTNGILRLTGHAKCLPAEATVWIWAPGKIDLAFVGLNKIKDLYIDGEWKAPGAYGSSQLPGHLSGTGFLTTGQSGAVFIVR